MVRAVFFDIDGTLMFYDRAVIPESARSAVASLHDKGILTFIATGRPLVDLPNLPLGDLAFDGYIALDGLLVCDGNRGPLCTTPISPRDTGKIVSWFRSGEASLLLIEENAVYHNHVPAWALELGTMIGVPPLMPGEYTGEPIYQAVLFLEENGRRPPLEELEDCRFRPWNSMALDIVPATCGKSIGMRAMMERYGFAREEAMAFGDADNDADMLKFAGIGVAMGNGTQKAKESADYVTDEIGSDGILTALRHFGIL